MNCKQMIATAMAENRETLLDLVDNTMTDDEMLKEIEIKTIEDIPALTAWSNDYVYFININVRYNLNVTSVPRNPNGVRVSPIDLQ